MDDTIRPRQHTPIVPATADQCRTPNRHTACTGLRVPGRQAKPDFALYHQVPHRIVDRRRQNQPLRRYCTCNGHGRRFPDRWTTR